jgi:hypothetical protein
MRTAMRRLLLVFLLVLMPLQTVWSAAAAYCAHEQAPAAAHFGHHVHKHAGAHQGGDAHADVGHASADDAQGGAAGSIFNLGSADLDCHSCHGSGTVLFAHTVAPAALALCAHPLPLVAAQLPAPLSPRPERPNWPYAA